MYILLNYENKIIVLKKLWNLWTVFSSAVIRELRTSILRPWGSLICDKRGREKTSFCDQQDLKNPQSTRKTMHVRKFELHKSLMFGATENILLSESIVLMCFCLPPVLGNGTEWKYMHHGGRKELRLCLEQHMSKPVISRSWNSLIFWPFHSVLASKLKRLISWNENIREIYFRMLKQFGSVQHVPFLKWKCTWPSFKVWACPVCPPVRQHLQDHTPVLCPRGRSLCINL